MRRLLILIGMISTAILNAQTTAQTPQILTMEFKGFPVSFQEIVNVCQKNGVTLGPTYNPKSVTAVRSVLEKLLEENGKDGIVNFEINNSQQPRSTRLTFSVAGVQ